jgi:hypothetical protein
LARAAEEKNAVPGHVSVVKISSSTVDAQALTIKGNYGRSINGKAFQQEAMVTYRGWQYLGYYDAKRRVCIARRKLPKGEWQIARFGDHRFGSNNAHNTISIGVCPKDATIHMAFDHHASRLHYRVSRKGTARNPEEVSWTPKTFGPIHSALEEGKPIRGVTYPRFWQTPDGGLQFCYRRGVSGRGDRMLVDYDPAKGQWTGTRQIDSGEGLFRDKYGMSKSRCSYPNGYDYGPKGRLHATWVWREWTNHDLAYAYSEDRGKTWANNKGVKLDGPPSISSPNIHVVKIPRLLGLMNTHGQTVDTRGRVHVVMWHCTPESIKAAGGLKSKQRFSGPQAARRYHHYWRDLDGSWKHRELPGTSGSRPKVFTDKKDNAYLIFGKGGNLCIAAASSASKWTDWKVVHREKGPFGNEMLGDPYRWKREGVLSVMVQERPETDHQPTALRVLDFRPSFAAESKRVAPADKD